MISLPTGGIMYDLYSMTSFCLFIRIFILVMRTWKDTWSLRVKGLGLDVSYEGGFL